MTSNNIYEQLKQRIISGQYSIKMMLPTEDLLIKEFHASRYAIRKAIQSLATEGLIYSVKGKGVVVLENNFRSQKINLNFNKIDNLQSTKQDFELHQKINLLYFKLMLIDEPLSQKTLFPIGTPIYSIKRVRNINGEKLVLDINYFNAQLVPEITPKIATDSIYNYIKNDLQMNIAVVKKQLRVEAASDFDIKNLSLKKANCIGNMINYAYNNDGKQFEYTESHFIPNSFVFNQIITF